MYFELKPLTEHWMKSQFQLKGQQLMTITKHDGYHLQTMNHPLINHKWCFLLKTEHHLYVFRIKATHWALSEMSVNFITSVSQSEDGKSFMWLAHSRIHQYTMNTTYVRHVLLWRVMNTQTQATSVLFPHIIACCGIVHSGGGKYP